MDITTELQKRLENLSINKPEKLDKAQISQVGLSILSKEEIEKISVVRVDSSDLKEDNGGLYDKMMGTIDNEECRYCHQDVMNCPGHFGYIEIAEKFYHPAYIKLIAKILNLFCYGCYNEDGSLKMLVPRQELEKYKNIGYLQRLNQILEHANKGCEKHPCRKYEVKEDVITYTYQKTSTVIPIDIIEDLLTKMSNQDLHLLGIVGVRPEDFIVKAVPVLPINLRPYNVLDGMVKHHDMTLVYKEIITANNKVAYGDIMSPEYQIAQERVKKFFNGLIYNKQGKCKGIHGHVYQTLQSMIDTKAGHMRSIAFGKRGNFSGRTVISPDPNIKVYEVGIPNVMADVLTTEESVTRFNINQIKDMIMNNKVKSISHKGVKTLIYNVEDKSSIEVRPGDIIKRYLQNGDVVILNRQPTLHKQGMIALTVRRLSGLTIRLNPAITTGLNADFDGDEANFV